MGPRYEVVLFYGLFLSEKYLLQLANQGEHEGPKEIPAFLEEYEESERIVFKLDSFIIQLNDRLPRPVRIHYFRGVPGDLEETSENLNLYCLVIEETYHSISDPLFSMNLSLDTDEWDKLLKKVCEDYGFSWDQPVFHLHFDYCYGHWPWASYEAVFFYGVIMTVKDRDYRSNQEKFTWSSNQDLSKFVKIMFEKHRNLTYSDEELFRQISPEIMHTYYESYDEERDTYYDSYDEERGTYYDSYDAERFYDEISWAKLEKLIWQSDDFRKWIPDKKTISDIIVPDFIKQLEKIWAAQGDPICLGIMISNEGLIIYLGIREARHGLYGEESSGSFQLSHQNIEKWNLLLTEKCKNYGLELQTPKFYLLHCDLVG
jgi:hypothetical protein